MDTLLYIAAAVLLVFNLVVNLAAVRSPYCSNSQKVVQSLLIWLLPLIGLLAVGIILRQMSYEDERRADHFPGLPNGDSYSQGPSFVNDGAGSSGGDGD